MEVVKIDWPCAICGGRNGLKKYEVVTTPLEYEVPTGFVQHPGSMFRPSPVGGFQRHLCKKCVPLADDIFMQALSEAGMSPWTASEDSLPGTEGYYVVVVTNSGGRRVACCRFVPGKGWLSSIVEGVLEVQVTDISHWWSAGHPLPEGV
jgi:hypothetical protein